MQPLLRGSRARGIRGVKRKFEGARNKLERAKNEAVLLVTEQLVTGTASSSQYASFKEEKKDEGIPKRSH